MNFRYTEYKFWYGFVISLIGGSIAGFLGAPLYKTSAWQKFTLMFIPGAITFIILFIIIYIFWSLFQKKR
jgi:hypothetical protein